MYVFVYGYGMGRPKLPGAKVAVTIRIEPAVLAAYQAMGELWRERMVQALRDGPKINAAVVTGSGEVRLERPAPKPGKLTSPVGMDGKPLSSVRPNRLKNR